ncbi:MAG: hypothetical protein ACRC62_03805 [Microcoleus sp.]
MEEAKREKCADDFDEQLECLKKILEDLSNKTTYKVTIEKTSCRLIAEGGHRVKVSGEGADAKYETAKYFPKITRETSTIFSQTTDMLNLSMVVKAVNGL